MGLEHRKSGVYYYRSRRIGKQVQKEYVGGGRIGEFAAQLDAIEREKREVQRAADLAQREEVAALDAPLAELNELADLLVRAALVAAGYRQHHRGNWRKRRVHDDRAD